MSKYDYELSLDNNTSTGMIIKLISPNSVILEFGCAAGRMTRYLHEKLHCKVFIIEKTPEDYKKASVYATGGFNGDIMSFEWMKTFNGIKFDYIIFADVLEHLPDPCRVLSETKNLLKEDGSVLASIPNAAHADILLNLLENNLHYSTVGLLDNTHIHLFAYNDLKQLIKEAGYNIVLEDATYNDEYCTEQAQYLSHKIDHGNYNQIIAERSLNNVYQFILKMQKTEYVERFYIPCISHIDHTCLLSHISIFNVGSNEAMQCKINNSCLDNHALVHVDLPSPTFNFEFAIQQQGPVLLTELVIYGDGYIGSFKPSTNKVNTDSVSSIHIHNSNSMSASEWIILRNSKSRIEVWFSAPVTSVAISYTFIPLYGDLEKIAGIFASDYSVTVDKNIIHAGDNALIDKISKDEKHNIEQNKCDEPLSDKQILEQKLKNYISISDSIEKFMKKRSFNNNVNTVSIDKSDIQYKYKNLLYEEEQTKQIIETVSKGLADKGIYEYLFPAQIAEPTPKPIITDNEWRISGRLTLNNYFQGTDRKYSFPDVKSLKINSIPDCLINTASIAVQLHLYYVDLIPEYFNYLNNIPFPFDLYISCQEDADMSQIGAWFRKLRYVNDVIIRKTANRGRDISPVYVLFRKEILKHDFLLHIHTKKSLFTGHEQTNWREYEMNSILGSDSCIRKIFTLFHSDLNIGLVYPDNLLMPWEANTWMSNANKASNLLKLMNIRFQNTYFNYPVGSFFWARVKAIKPLFDLELNYNDFDEEKGQTDGTLAHTLERTISWVSNSQGYHDAIIDLPDNVVRISLSYKPLQQYYNMNRDNLYRHLLNYDVISFDIFDTLITRRVYEPDDAFKLLQLQIKKRFGETINFIELRKEAEREANKLNQSCTNLDAIYECMKKISSLESSIIDQIKEMEIQNEISLCIPRKDMLWIYNHLKSAGKTIILTSDMYLNSSVIGEILNHCGYFGWDSLYISCEVGARKDTGELYKYIRSKYTGSETIIHIGDNIQSDFQGATNQRDLKIDAISIFSPNRSFMLTSLYQPIIDNYTASVPDSLILGTVINEYLFNSPFSFTGSENEPKPVKEADAGAAIFGPLMFLFARWLYINSNRDETLLFLAREGWLLQKIFNTYCSAADLKPNKNVYFLASRRAVSVPTLKTYEDLKELLSMHYVGTLGNLLRSRLGYEGIIAKQLSSVKVTDLDAEDITELLKPEYGTIFKNSEYEKAAYLGYIKEVVKDINHVSLVDLGYAGTIQYYLSKLVEVNIPGYYLATNTINRPSKRGGIFKSIYENENGNGNDSSSDLVNDSLMLEGALSAPYGQLDHFRINEDGESEPYYKDDITYNSHLHDLQQGILNFVGELATLFKTLPPEIMPGNNLCKKIYLVTHNNKIADYANQCMQVEDSYCTDASYNFKTKQWVSNNTKHK